MSNVNNELTEIDLSPIRKYQTRELCDFCLNVKPQFACPYYKECPYQKKCKANVVINEYKDTKEILIFKDAFWQRQTLDISKKIDRTRKFIYNDQGILVPKDENSNISIFKLKNTLLDSRKRAVQNFYGYVRSNEWKYFITVTVANTVNVNKYNDEEVEHVWELLRKKLQYYFNDIKILLVKEYHKKGGLHFHGFIGNCNLEKYLTIAINSGKTYKHKGKKLENKYYMQPLKTEFGDQVYNLIPKIYDKGHIEIVKIKEDDNNNFKLANYLSKYFLKDKMQVKYSKKLYWHTYNLDFYNKEVFFLTDNEKQEVINDINLLNFIHYKETEKAYIYTIKK